MRITRDPAIISWQQQRCGCQWGTVLGGREPKWPMRRRTVGVLLCDEHRATLWGPS